MNFLKKKHWKEEEKLRKKKRSRDSHVTSRNDGVIKYTRAMNTGAESSRSSCPISSLTG